MTVAFLLTAAWLFVSGSPDQGPVSVSAAPPCVAPPPDMISWWSGDGDANDIAGGNNGTMQGGAGFGAGEVAQGFALNGTDAGVSVPDAPSLNFGPGADFSIDAWVRAEVKQTPTFPGLDIQTIVDKRYTPNSSSARGYTLFLINGQVGFQLADENNYYNFPPAGPDLRDGQFHLVAVTVDRDNPSGGHLYIDGISVSTFDPTNRMGDLTNAQPLLIGIHAQAGLNAFFQGVIDEVEIFDRELSSAEVQAIYTAGGDGKCKPGATPTPVPDADGDGVPDATDNCPLTPNANQNDTDGDGIGNVCDPINDLDLDNDGIPNAVDNCPTTANTNQADGDGDGIGDACDSDPNDGPTGDLDGDGDVNNVDNCPTTPNADQRDTNGDGTGDLCTPFQYATGGQFVIGNFVSLVGNSTVYFWGSQWSQNNPMSGGAAPNSFKGFENGLALPTCGSSWVSRPGNSSIPPATVPGNMAVIVSSAITKSGSTISGNVKKIVVIQTNPGYGPAPGKVGTGKVIAILCSAP
jgi:hypothetical protein